MPKSTHNQWKDKENETVEVEKWELSCLPKSVDFEVTQDLSLLKKNQMEVQCKEEPKPIIWSSNSTQGWSWSTNLPIFWFHHTIKILHF